MKNNDHSVKNIPASVRVRLLNIAKSVNKDFNAVLLQYFQERFLFRLSQSRYRDSLILKGALLFLVNQISRVRPTKDIDFLELGITNNQNTLENVIREIIQIHDNDGIVFNTDSVSSEIITLQNEYPGLRINFDGNLGNIHKSLQIDVGFGDEIVPEPVEVYFPVILDNYNAPYLLIYSLESAIAEKFEAIVKFSHATSRMKNFYDIWFLSENMEFKYETLRLAIRTTFMNRGTDITEYQIIFSDDFKESSSKKETWHAFLNRNRLDCKYTFTEIMNSIEYFLKPVCLNDSVEFIDKIWKPAIKKWE
jgi:predicted nucleotidyltransferase component of viral defense system